jgi:hypothetical protein
VQMLWFLHERWKVRLDDGTYISVKFRARRSAVGSAGADSLELHRVVSWWLLVRRLHVYSCVYVHDAHMCLLVFGDDEYWRASHVF